MNPIQYAELGGMFIISMALIELVKYLVSRAKPTGFNGSTKAILHELEIQNSNHLSHIQDGVEGGFREMIRKQDECTIRLAEKLDRMIECLGRIDGKIK